MGLLSLLSNFGAIKDKAPEMLSGFLNELLEQNRSSLDLTKGECQICYLMTPVRNADKPEYNIAIVALSHDDRILRIIKSMPLSDVISTLLKNMPDA